MTSSEPLDLTEYIEMILKKVEASSGAALVGALLSLLAFAREGLSEIELESLLFPYTDGRSTASWWPKLTCELTGIVVLLGSHMRYDLTPNPDPSSKPNHLARLSHDAVRKVVQRRYVTEAEGGNRRWHLELAAFFEGHPAEVRGVSERLHHLHAAGEWIELCRAVTSRRTLSSLCPSEYPTEEAWTLSAAFKEHYDAGDHSVHQRLLRSRFFSRYSFSPCASYLTLFSWKVQSFV